MSARIPSLYVTTEDNKQHSHTYRLSVTDTVPDGHEITNVRPAGVNRFSSLLSPESLIVLKIATGRTYRTQ
jgi:hypothetical protein